MSGCVMSGCVIRGCVDSGYVVIGPTFQLSSSMS